MDNKKERLRKQLENKKYYLPFSLIIIAALIIAVCSAVYSAKDTYAEQKQAAYDRVYEGFYDHAFDHAERAYHVANRISISLGDIRETANLRVLEVTDVEYIVENESDNEDGITAWLEVPGNGFFTVDLQTGEFLVNTERREVVVRIPEPVLSDFTIDYQNVNRLYFNNRGGNDSIAVGEELARKQCREAYSELHTAFMSDPKYLESAKRSAETILTNLIRQLNPDVPDLKVLIEYM